MRAAEPQLQQLTEVTTAAEEVVRLSPVRWRRRRVIRAYRAGAAHMERAFRNSRGLVRRIGTTLRDGEPVPAGLPAAVEHLGEAVRLLHREFLAAREPVQARERVLRAVREAGGACRQDIGFSGTIVVPNCVPSPTTCSGPPACPGTRPAGWSARPPPLIGDSGTAVVHPQAQQHEAQHRRDQVRRHQHGHLGWPGRRGRDTACSSASEPLVSASPRAKTQQALQPGAGRRAGGRVTPKVSRRFAAVLATAVTSSASRFASCAAEHRRGAAT